MSARSHLMFVALSALVAGGAAAAEKVARPDLSREFSSICVQAGNDASKIVEAARARGYGEVGPAMITGAKATSLRLELEDVAFITTEFSMIMPASEGQPAQLVGSCNVSRQDLKDGSSETLSRMWSRVAP